MNCTPDVRTVHEIALLVLLCGHSPAPMVHVNALSSAARDDARKHVGKPGLLDKRIGDPVCKEALQLLVHIGSAEVCGTALQRAKEKA